MDKFQACSRLDTYILHVYFGNLEGLLKYMIFNWRVICRLRAMYSSELEFEDTVV